MPTRISLLERLGDRLPGLWLLLLLLVSAAFTWQPLSGGDDVWAHAAIGRWIAENNAWPRETLFLWSVPPQPWVYHSWLSQVVFYQALAWDEGTGAVCLLLLTTLLVVGVFIILWRFWLLNTQKVSLWMPLVFALALSASALRFRPRPEIFTAFLLTVLLCLLWRKKSASRALWLEVVIVFCLFVLWANLHGAVAIGLVLLGAVALAELFQERFRLHSWRGVLLLAVAGGAVCLTPYGMDYWQALRPVGGTVFQRIDEWKPFWKTPVLNPEIIVAQFILVWLAFICWMGNKERRWAHIACLFIMTLMFLGARRHLWLLSIVSVSVIAANAQTLGTLALRNNVTSLARQRARWLVSGGLVVLLAQAISTQVLQNGVLAPAVPLTATTYFKQHKLDGHTPIFNDYENSSFLQWRFAGKPPLYIDLLNAYPDSLVSNYFDIINVRPRGVEILEREKVQTVILRAHGKESPLAKLAAHLDADTAWDKVYSGQDGAIWLRKQNGSPLP